MLRRKRHSKEELAIMASLLSDLARGNASWIPAGQLAVFSAIAELYQEYAVGHKTVINRLAGDCKNQIKRLARQEVKRILKKRQAEKEVKSECSGS